MCVCVCVQRGYYERAESFVLIDIVRFDKMVFFDRMCGESLMNVIGMLILNAVRFMKMECWKENMLIVEIKMYFRVLLWFSLNLKTLSYIFFFK